MSDFPITIFHNPAYGASRNTVARVRAAGHAPEVVEYLQAGWTKTPLQALLAAMGARPRDVLREKRTPAADLGLAERTVSIQKVMLLALSQGPQLTQG